jgi:hypothetical protein
MATRCAIHPGRAGVDACPVCGRLRCREDSRRLAAAGCLACYHAQTEPRARPFELAVRGGLAAMPGAYVGGWIATQYVDTRGFSLIVPALVGLAATWLVGLASYRAGARGAAVLVVGVVGGLLGTALGFRLYPNGPHDPLRPWSLVGAPYLCAVAGALLWWVVLRPPRRAPQD